MNREAQPLRETSSCSGTSLRQVRSSAGTRSCVGCGRVPGGPKNGFRQNKPSELTPPPPPVSPGACANHLRVCAACSAIGAAEEGQHIPNAASLR